MKNIFVYLFPTENDRNSGNLSQGLLVGEALNGAQLKNLAFSPQQGGFKFKAYTPDKKKWFTYQEALRHLGVEITKDGCYDKVTHEYI
jgi:hypothetical protein